MLTKATRGLASILFRFFRVTGLRALGCKAALGYVAEVLRVADRGTETTLVRAHDLLRRGSGGRAKLCSTSLCLLSSM